MPNGDRHTLLLARARGLDLSAEPDATWLGRDQASCTEIVANSGSWSDCPVAPTRPL